MGRPPRLGPARVPSRASSAAPGIALSSVAVVPTVSGSGADGALDRFARLLGECYARGVSTFDLAGSDDPYLSGACLTRAFPEPRPDLVVIVPGERGEPTRAGSGPLPRVRDPLQPRVGSSGQTLPLPEWLPPARRLVEVDPARSRRASDFHEFLRSELGPGAAGEAPALKVVRCRSSDEAKAAAEHPARPLLSAELSLLAPGAFEPASASWTSRGPIGIARNVFANGRLDGSRWEVRGAASPRALHVAGLRELEEEFAPVLSLGFLTAGGKRTLAQAALAYVLSVPWVLAASVPLPSADRLDEVLGYASAPALTGEELARIAALGGATSDPTGG